MIIKYEHGKGKEEAYQKIDSLLNELQKKYSNIISNPYKKWNNSNDKMEFSLSMKNFNLYGDVEVTENQIVLNGKIPFVARFLKGKIESMITEKLDELFK